MLQRTQKLTKAELAVQQDTQSWEESLRQLGQHLRQLRQDQALSIDELHRLTLVPRYQLEALETGQVERLPEAVYLRGFIQRVGNALGAQGGELVATLPLPDPQQGLLPSWTNAQVQSDSGLYLRPVHLYVTYLALMAGAVSGLSHTVHHSTLDAVMPSSSLVGVSNLAEFNQPDMTVSQVSRQVHPATSLSQNGATGARRSANMAPPETLPF